MQAELHYVEGLLEGSCREYFPTGRLASVSEYAKGKKEGISLVYDETSTVETRETYVADSLTHTERGVAPTTG